MSLRELYQEMILDHGRHPRHFGVMENPTHQKEGHNPLCGDQLTLYVREEAGVVSEVLFKGVGCAISIASASLLTESVKNKNIDEVKTMFESFHLLATEGVETAYDLGKLVIFKGVFEFPARVKCATLAWHTLSAALNHDHQPVSTE